MLHQFFCFGCFLVHDDWVELRPAVRFLSPRVQRPLSRLELRDALVQVTRRDDLSLEEALAELGLLLVEEDGYLEVNRDNAVESTRRVLEVLKTRFSCELIDCLGRRVPVEALTKR